MHAVSVIQDILNGPHDPNSRNFLFPHFFRRKTSFENLTTRTLRNVRKCEDFFLLYSKKRGRESPGIHVRLDGVDQYSRQ